MIGAAALLMGASFTSCSKDKDLYDPQANALKFLQDYQAAFISVFGQPAANQTWGFGEPAATSRVTRAVFSNGNEWAANDRDDCKYKVPPVLTDDQKKIVRIYFQNKPNPDYVDPQWTDYFMQQVYKGGTNVGTISSEQYSAADGNTYIGSNQMNYLYAVDSSEGINDHIQNFNYGDAGWYNDVLNYKGTLTTVEETYPVNSGNSYRHSDQINLLTNSTTAHFGYHVSNSSVLRTEYAGLVNWQTIKTWADANGYAGQADCLNDGWNRSFMGFDYEGLINDEIYAKNENGTYKYLTYGDLPSGKNYVWDGNDDNKATARPSDDTQILYNGQPVKMLITNRNMIGGVKGDFDQNNLYTRKNIPIEVNGETRYQEDDCIDLTKIFEKLSADYIPVEGGGGYQWSKVQPFADTYYSDWIVCLTKAEKYDGSTPTPNPTTKSIRIMAEDVAANAGSDIDFNDVVFDVTADFGESGTSVSQVQITLLAAGGTMPLYIGNTTTALQHEVHGEFGNIDVRTMINTQAAAYADGENYFAQDGVPTKTFTLTGVTISKDNFESDVNTQVVLTVNNQGTTIPVLAEVGEPAAKIAVPVGTPWMKERVNIGLGFSWFNNWVKSATSANWNDYDSSRVLR